jgi:hypothetical protein
MSVAMKPYEKCESCLGLISEISNSVIGQKQTVHSSNLTSIIDDKSVTNPNIAGHR